MPSRKPAKKAASKKSSSRSVSAPRPKTHPLHEHYYLEEQEAFFSKHPMSQMLLTVFLICVVAFFAAVYMRRDVYFPSMGSSMPADQAPMTY